jgi:hypothetical protein
LEQDVEEEYNQNAVEKEKECGIWLQKPIINKIINVKVLLLILIS